MLPVDGAWLAGPELPLLWNVSTYQPILKRRGAQVFEGKRHDCRRKTDRDRDGHIVLTTGQRQQDDDQDRKRETHRPRVPQDERQWVTVSKELLGIFAPEKAKLARFDTLRQAQIRQCRRELQAVSELEQKLVERPS